MPCSKATKITNQMELSHCYLIKPNHLLSAPSIPKPKFYVNSSHKIHTKQWGLLASKQRLRSTVVMASAKVDLMKELEQEDDDEWDGIGGRWKDKCKGEGIVEVMECLEREAIMGEDYGREPNDYNRRAHVFDKSNKVFQALKDKERNSEMLVS